METRMMVLKRTKTANNIKTRSKRVSHQSQILKEFLNESNSLK